MSFSAHLACCDVYLEPKKVSSCPICCLVPPRCCLVTAGQRQEVWAGKKGWCLSVRLVVADALFAHALFLPHAAFGAQHLNELNRIFSLKLHRNAPELILDGCLTQFGDCNQHAEWGWDSPEQVTPCLAFAAWFARSLVPGGAWSRDACWRWFWLIRVRCQYGKVRAVEKAKATEQGTTWALQSRAWSCDFVVRSSVPTSAAVPADARSTCGTDMITDCLFLALGETEGQKRKIPPRATHGGV